MWGATVGCHWIKVKFFWTSGLRSSCTKNEVIWKKKKATEPVLSVGCFIAHNTHIGTDTQFLTAEHIILDFLKEESLSHGDTMINSQVMKRVSIQLCKINRRKKTHSEAYCKQHASS